jgi:hypothetical protein
MDTIPVMRYPILGAALLLTIVLGCDRQETVVVRKVVTTTAPANGKPATLPLRPQTAPTDGHYREKTRPVVDALQQVSSDFQAEVDDEIAAAHFAAADVAFQRWAEELTRSEEAMESCKKLRSVHAGFRESISAARRSGFPGTTTRQKPLRRPTQRRNDRSMRRPTRPPRLSTHASY